jgi:glycosyltransferase involved in cell wall biosynthesis
VKILVTVDPEIPVPPKEYGGIERIADGLIKEYVANGHTVILLAHPSSTCESANKIIGWDAGQSRGTKNIWKNAKQLLRVVKAEKPDVVHSFSRLLYLYPLFFFTKVPVLQSYQREISTISTDLARSIAGKRLLFTACAGFLYGGFRNSGIWTTIPNFTNTDYYVPDKTVEKDILFFLGRIQEIKGTKEAIDTAILSNQKLVIAGNVPPEHQDYFNHEVKPHLNNPLIAYVGPVDDEQKKYYLQRSKALLFPIKWEEPFGIVMAESMACGTPVIAFERGSVTEVIENGVNGYIVNSTQEMVEAIDRLPYISRDIVRNYCETSFSQQVVAQSYLELLTNVQKRV